MDSLRDVPSDMIETHASLHEAHNLSEQAHRTHTRLDTATMSLNTPHSFPYATIHQNKGEQCLPAVRTLDACLHINGEVSPLTRQPQSREAVSEDKEMSTSEYSPVTKAAPMPPVHSAVCPTQAVPPCPSGDVPNASHQSGNQAKLPCPVVHKQHRPTNTINAKLATRNNTCQPDMANTACSTTLQLGKKVVSNKEWSAKQHSPIARAAIMLPSCLPVTTTRTKSLY